MAENIPSSILETPTKQSESSMAIVQETPSKKKTPRQLDTPSKRKSSMFHESILENEPAPVAPSSPKPSLPTHPSRVSAEMGKCHRQVPLSRDPRINGSTYTKVDVNHDSRDSHELFLLGDGEKKVEMTPVTQVANAAIFTFNKEDHTLGNMLTDKLTRLEHVTFAAYKVPHPLFATFDLRVHTDGDISPKEAVVQACQELVQELQTLDQEFTKEFELHRITRQGPGAGLDHHN